LTKELHRRAFEPGTSFGTPVLAGDPGIDDDEGPGPVFGAALLLHTR